MKPTVPHIIRVRGLWKVIRWCADIGLNKSAERWCSRRNHGAHFGVLVD